MKKVFYHYWFESPVGTLILSSDDEKLRSISFSSSSSPIVNSDILPEILKQSIYQLEEYFNGSRIKFELKLNVEGTTFQEKVWDYIQNIPFGETATYNEVAEALGSKKLSRAVGYANSQNQIPIIIPCHRIIGSDGKLTGYAGGIEHKKWLLQHELKYATSKNRLF